MKQLLHIKNFFKKTYILSDIYKILTIIYKTIKIVKRIIDIFFMYLSLNLYPTITYKFSTRKLLPQPEQRHKLNKENFLPVKIISKEKSTMKYFDEVNVVAYGSSFNIDDIKKFKDPTFLISFWAALRKKKDGSLVINYTHHDARFNSNIDTLEPYNNENLFYVVGRQDTCRDLIDNDCNILNIEGEKELISGDYIPSNNYHKPYSVTFQQQEIAEFKKYKKKIILSITENFRKPYQTQSEARNYFTPNGSFIPSVLALIPFCKKINIFGWDFYLDQNANDLNTFQIYKSLFNPKLDWGPTRSWFHFESTLMNYYYAYFLSKKKNIKIHSHLSGIKKHEKLIKNIEKVLFI
jgi:hypothetical protein